MMGGAGRLSIRWGVAVCAAALAVSFVAVFPRPAGGGVSGSKHDFSDKTDISSSAGVCTPCHRVHDAPEGLGIWKRSLFDERERFDQDGDPTRPNYLATRGGSILCYDCHDDMAGTNPDPASSVWSPNKEPQDIALGGTLIGYYEEADGTMPGPIPAPDPPINGNPTGGHYWRTEPSDPDDLRKQGDKISCSLCHDPHDALTGAGLAKNMVFFRTESGDGTAVPLGDGHLSSTNTRSGADMGASAGNGRSMCEACHGNSDQGAQQSFFTVVVPKPTDGIGQHVYSSAATAPPCTDCHPHNRPAGCNDCHGYPPLLTRGESGNNFFNRVDYPNTESYEGGAGAHRRHKDVLGPALFKCEICHGPAPGAITTPWHAWDFQNGRGTTVVAQANVDIIGDATYWGTGSGYAGSTNGQVVPTPTGYSFTAKGGKDGTAGGRCYTLACHGSPPQNTGTVFLNWTDDLVDDAPGPNYGNPVGDGLAICKWCHDTTPAQIGAWPTAPNVLGDNNGSTGVWNTGTWGADVNGHGHANGSYEGNAVGESPRVGAPAANKQCTVCHDATYSTLAWPAVNTPAKPHYNDTSERLRGTINGDDTIADSPDKTCTACHQIAGRTDSATADSLVVTHGNSTADGYKNWEPDPFVRRCRACHEPHGANWNGVTPNPRNLHMLGKWVDGDGDGQTDGAALGVEAARVDSNATGVDPEVLIDANDAPVILKSAGNPSQTYPDARADDSWDDGTGGTGGDGVTESLCVVCHGVLVNSHTDLAHQSGTIATRGLGHLPVGTQCRICHQHGTLASRPNMANDAFGPLSCFACHGVAPLDNLPSGEVRGQYWPSGDASKLPPYAWANDQKGDHRNHIDAIGMQIFGELAADLVTSDTATNPGRTAFEKQVAVCIFCHYDPGGADANPDTVPHFTDASTDGSPLGRVDVKQGDGALRYLLKFTTGNGPYGNRTNFGDDPDGGAYNFNTQSCANLVCHNRVATPPAPGGWGNPPAWASVVNSRCSNITCHDPGLTYTNSHGVHVNSTAKSYECYECHANNGTALGHGNGKVDMVWDNAPALEGSIGGDDGFYDKEPGGASSPGDTAFEYRDGTYNVACGSVYCHGGDDAAWGGADTTPVWDNALPDSVYCGSCHDANASDAVNPGGTDVIGTGNHTDHLTAAWGPGFANAPGSPQTSCLGTLTTGCHTDYALTTPTHVDGSVQFDNIVGVPPYSILGTAAVSVPTAAETDRCSHCHSTRTVTTHVAGPATVTGAGAALAKANWGDNAYTLPCLTCHNPPATAGTTLADGSNGPGDQDYAPDMLGNDLLDVDPGGKYLGYGAEVSGHNRAATDGAYPVSGNPAGARLCPDCHDAAAAHINGSNDTSYRPGNRMRNDINGANPNTPTQACQACHAVGATGSSPVQTTRNKVVNSHGNNGAAFLEPAAFSLQCLQCHDPHGMTSNGTGFNIQMISPTIDVAAGVTAAGVRFEALTGANSFNDGDANDAVDICVVCHMNDANPGFSMDYSADGQHSLTPGYSNDERGSNCSGCHTHNQDYPRNAGHLTTADGFMPLECNSCHTYPGKDDLGAPTHPLSTSHAQHVGVPVGATPPVPNYGAVFTCPLCHYQSSHNNRGLNAGDTWTGVTDAMVQVRFNGSWNPVAAANNHPNRTNDSSSYDDTNNVCNDLYCHGAAAPFPPADRGPDTTPDWDNSATANCGMCHNYTAAVPPGDLAHPVHAGSGAGQYGIGCQVCHYGTTQTGTTIQSVALHVDRSVEVSFSETADLRVHFTSSYNGDRAVGSGYGDCLDTYCHSNGADTSAPFTAANLDPAQTLAWDGNATCWSCHGNGTDSPAPAYADGTTKANKHPLHTGTGDPAATPNTNGYGCAVCHWPTVHGNTSIFTIANHVNRTYEVDDDGAGSTLDQFTYTTGTPGSCGSANCHGGNSGISWGQLGPIACDVCHAEVGGVAAAADVNDFHWDGTVQSKIANDAGGEYAAVGHGAKSVDCAACHSSSVGHDTHANLTGGNPFRLLDNGGAGPGNFTCADVTSSCHATRPLNLVRDHTSADMYNSGYTPQVDSWSFTPKCPDCHDPHGDDANVHMVQREVVEGSNGNWVPTVWPAENPNLVFTDDVTGLATTPPYVTYADGGPRASLCQACHESADADFTSFKAGGALAVLPHPLPGENPGDCSLCHRHRGGFAPTGCEGCHNGDGDGDGVWTGVGYDPDGAGPKPSAPNVMGLGVDPVGIGTSAKPYDDGAWGFNVNGHGANGTAPATPVNSMNEPYLTGDAECTDCHNIASPIGTHLNGVLNSVELKQNPNANTAHLNPTAYIGTASPDWDVQVTFDNQCSLQCHPAGIRHRHSKDAVPALGAVRFGDKGVGPVNGELIALPIDSALSTNAATAEPDFAPCISCHNPHGTGIVEDSKATNRMLRDNWVVPDNLCTLYCHRTYP